ncbi:MAG TPA: RdgB/HAM1 family non-canonical purine NTP pyrophosphatase [Fibrobacteria bacterium]|nr:RdgB/HAM1 family non-canonical purine NTP pyrophosphatase [Fibrobacteria bacterium]
MSLPSDPARVPHPPRPLVLATGNRGKVAEFQALLAPAGFTLLLPADLGFSADVEETADTFMGNAFLKAGALAAVSPHPVLADDSGVQVDALGGAPGIFSARYASLETGPQPPGGAWTDASGKPLSQAAANRAKLLRAMEGERDRRACFRCVLCYLVPGREAAFFEGVCEGEIIREERGGSGFGYDPLFIPRGHDKTFAELPGDVKDALSHRGKAVALFLESLASRA